MKTGTWTGVTLCYFWDFYIFHPRRIIQEWWEVCWGGLLNLGFEMNVRMFNCNNMGSYMLLLAKPAPLLKLGVDGRMDWNRFSWVARSLCTEVRAEPCKVASPEFHLMATKLVKPCKLQRNYQWKLRVQVFNLILLCTPVAELDFFKSVGPIPKQRRGSC
jgi:hypothetical protein